MAGISNNSFRGRAVSARASANVTAGRFVKLTNTDGDLSVAHCGAGEAIFGVAGDDTTSGNNVAVFFDEIGLLEVNAASTNIASGDTLKPTTAGVGIKASGSDAFGAIAMEPATTDGAVIRVFVRSNSQGLPAIGRANLTEDALAPQVLDLADFLVTGTGARLGTTAGTPSGAFGLTVGTHGSATFKLVGEAASGNSKTNKARITVALPDNYVSGGDIKVRLSARITGNVQVAQTLDVTAYKGDGAAGVGSDICDTTAQTLTASFANYDFVITPTGLVAGDVLDIELTGLANDTGGTANKLIEIGKVTLLRDVKG